MKYPENEDKIEYLGKIEIPEGAIVCKRKYPDPDEAWMYDSA